MSVDVEGYHRLYLKWLGLQYLNIQTARDSDAFGHRTCMFAQYLSQMPIMQVLQYS